METFYDMVQILSHCGYLSPDQYKKEISASIGRKCIKNGKQT